MFVLQLSWKDWMMCMASDDMTIINVEWEEYNVNNVGDDCNTTVIKYSLQLFQFPLIFCSSGIFSDSAHNTSCLFLI